MDSFINKLEYSLCNLQGYMHIIQMKNVPKDESVTRIHSLERDSKSVTTVAKLSNGIHWKDATILIEFALIYRVMRVTNSIANIRAIACDANVGPVIRVNTRLAGKTSAGCTYWTCTIASSLDTAGVRILNADIAFTNEAERVIPCEWQECSGELVSIIWNTYSGSDIGRNIGGWIG